MGDNGSGKSAILAGIQLGLGSKANLTGKSTSAKGITKKEHRASLILLQKCCSDFE
jgi:predicted ATPase